MAKIHIQFTLFSAFYSPLISTMTGNFLSEEGFDYEWSVAEPGVSALEALAAGTAQVVQSTISQGFSSLEKGDPPTARHFALLTIWMDFSSLAGIATTISTGHPWKGLKCLCITVVSR